MKKTLLACSLALCSAILATGSVQAESAPSPEPSAASAQFEASLARWVAANSESRELWKATSRIDDECASSVAALASKFGSKASLAETQASWTALRAATQKSARERALLAPRIDASREIIQEEERRLQTLRPLSAYDRMRDASRKTFRSQDDSYPSIWSGSRHCENAASRLIRRLSPD